MVAAAGGGDIKHILFQVGRYIWLYCSQEVTTSLSPRRRAGQRIGVYNSIVPARPNGSSVYGTPRIFLSFRIAQRRFPYLLLIY